MIPLNRILAAVLLLVCVLWTFWIGPELFVNPIGRVALAGLGYLSAAVGTATVAAAYWTEAP